MSAILQLAFYAIELINDQIKEGIDADGKRYAYSQKPFAMPTGGSRIKNYDRVVKDSTKVELFTSKATKQPWMIVKGGYKALREMRGRNPDGDYLQDTGNMLNALSAVERANNEAAIVFTDAKAAQRAFWLTVSGAGKGRKRWNFMNLTKQNQQKLADYAAELFGSSSSQIIELITSELV